MKNKPSSLVIISLIALVVIGIVTVKAAGPLLSGNNQQTPPLNSQSVDPNSLPAIQTGSYPWPPEINSLSARLSRIGLPQLSQEGTVLHTHQHLDVFINGNHLTLPADIGINDTLGFISPVHTHDETGIIHVESPVEAIFTLGQFFDIWGVRFTDYCLGGYCNGHGSSLRLYSNGQLVASNFRNLQLQPHQEIVITYGSFAAPVSIPSSYNFPPDY